MTLLLEPDQTLTLQRPGQDDVKNIRLRRAFPWSQETQYISVRDDKGKELTMIDRLDDLPSEQRQIVEQWLGQNSFIPVIRQIKRVNVDFGYQQWQVETDRGELSFRVQEREDIRFLPDGRFSIKDVDGNIYAMTRLDRLDPRSRKAVELLL